MGKQWLLELLGIATDIAVTASMPVGPVVPRSMLWVRLAVLAAIGVLAARGHSPSQVHQPS